MKNFYIADLHLGHNNVIRFDGRPFGNAEEMNKKIIENWNKTVTNADKVYILGDFVWGNEINWLETVPKLKGKKILIKGNHDLKQPGPEARILFEAITELTSIDDHGRRVIMCHYAIPFYKNAHRENVYMLYGHVHNTRENDFLEKWQCEVRKSRTESGHATGNFINVGCMMPWMDYTPRTLDEIIGGFEKYYAMKEEYDSKIALNAMKRINDSAKANGTSEMTLDEINEEINSYRKGK